MNMSSPPSNSRRLSETEISDTWINYREMWMRGLAFGFASAIVVSVITLIIGLTPLIAIVPAMYFFAVTSTKINQRKAQLVFF